MIPSNPICQVCDYGSSATYRELPSEEQIRNGVIPLDSLPASWWNCMWNMTNSAINQARGAVGVLIDEVNTVLQQAGVCVCDTCVDQLYRSIDKISQIVGTASRAGSVKSSSTCGEVSINSNGIMTANGLGNAAQLTTTAHTAVGAINELKSTYDSCWSANVTALGGKAPTSHASSGTSYGVGSASNYGHLKISDAYTSVLTACSGVAASQKALTCVYCYAAGIEAAALGLGNTAGCALGTAAAGTATTAARSDHVHPLPAITSLSGTLGIAHGGTGATTAANARTCLGLGTAATCAATAFLAAAGCAADSAKFAGCTYACAKADIRNYTPANATTATNADKGLSGSEYKSFGSAAFVATSSFRPSTWTPTASDVGAAPTSHASSATTYGVGSTTNYGHLKICDTYTSSTSAAAANGVAASQCAVYNAYTAARNFGNTAAYTKYVCNATGEAGAADCTVTLGYSRSYRWSSCVCNQCSFDRRTYMKVGTYQCQNACAGYAYLDVCNWQCCYSGTAGVTTCTNRRFYFKSDGSFCAPIHAASDTFGAALRTCRTGSTNMASVSFYNCTGLLGHLAVGTANSNFKRYENDNSTSYDIYDSSMTIPIANGGTGATTATAARTNLGLGSAAEKAAGSAAGNVPLVGTALGTTANKIVLTDASGALVPSSSVVGSAAYCAADCFRSSTWTPTCVACAGANGSGTAFGTAATCSAYCFRASTWVPECMIACEGGTSGTYNRCVFMRSCRRSAVSATVYCISCPQLTLDGSGRLILDSQTYTGCPAFLTHHACFSTVDATGTNSSRNIYFRTTYTDSSGNSYSRHTCICGANGYYYGDVCGSATSFAGHTYECFTNDIPTYCWHTACGLCYKVLGKGCGSLSLQITNGATCISACCAGKYLACILISLGYTCAIPAMGSTVINPNYSNANQLYWAGIGECATRVALTTLATCRLRRCIGDGYDMPFVPYAVGTLTFSVA